MFGADFADFLEAENVSDGYWIATCPVCNGRLCIEEDSRGVVNFHCQKGCSQSAIAKRLGLRLEEITSAPAHRTDFREMADWQIDWYLSKQNKRQKAHLRACRRLSDAQKSIDRIHQHLRIELLRACRRLRQCKREERELRA